MTSAEKKTRPTTGSQSAGNVNTGEQLFTIVSGTVKSKNEVLQKAASIIAQGENATNGIPVRIKKQTV